jgi:hypothetical protein
MIVYCFHCSRTSFLAALTVFLLTMLYKQMQALMLEENSFATLVKCQLKQHMSHC